MSLLLCMLYVRTPSTYLHLHITQLVVLVAYIASVQMEVRSSQTNIWPCSPLQLSFSLSHIHTCMKYMDVAFCSLQS